MSRPSKYIPALRFERLTAFYDPVVRLTTRERRFKSELVRQAQPKPGQSVLDLGCGTATLTLMLKRSAPGAEITGLDGDPRILEIARAKSHSSSLDVSFRQGLSFELPFTNGQFDQVVSSLFFHHLTRENKQRTLRETFRVLKPGGRLNVADWGPPQNALMRAAFLGVQLVEGFETTRDSVEGSLPSLCAAAGFAGAGWTSHLSTVFGTISLLSAGKP
jgi:ubiquinone/menaquinone biosynthesis C-methylase UbiE